jgi:acyl carrier protein
MEEKIIAYISDELVTDPGQLPLESDTPLIDTGVLDSLSLLRLVMFVEERFGITVAPEEVTPDNFATVNSISAYLRFQQQKQEA